jgi:hypothetical protein
LFASLINCACQAPANEKFYYICEGYGKEKTICANEKYYYICEGYRKEKMICANEKYYYIYLEGGAAGSLIAWRGGASSLMASRWLWVASPLARGRLRGCKPLAVASPLAMGRFILSAWTNAPRGKNFQNSK